LDIDGSYLWAPFGDSDILDEEDEDRSRLIWIEDWRDETWKTIFSLNVVDVRATYLAVSAISAFAAMISLV